MKKINVSEIKDQVTAMCIDANCILNDDVYCAVKEASAREDSESGKAVLNQLLENAQIAKDEMIPICQDTGMAIFFVSVGQDVHIEGGSLTDAINAGVRSGYKTGYLRKSVVEDPLLRKNTGDNTPAIIHYDIAEGNALEITFMPKGFGSENMSAVKMLKPSDGIEGVIKFVIETVSNAGPNPCPPIVVGVGIGGTMEKAAVLSKKALGREITSNHRDVHIAELENLLKEKINQLGIGPAGLGGSNTALGVNVETFATHIAGLPVAVNICCHVNRHRTIIL